MFLRCVNLLDVVEFAPTTSSGDTSSCVTIKYKIGNGNELIMIFKI